MTFYEYNFRVILHKQMAKAGYVSNMGNGEVFFQIYIIFKGLTKLDICSGV